LIISAAFQFARGHFVVANIEEQERLHSVDLQNAYPLELILCDVQEETLQSLHQSKRFQIARHEPSAANIAKLHLDTHPILRHLIS